MVVSQSHQVSYRGGVGIFPPPATIPPRNLKIECGYYCKKSCPRFRNLIKSKFTCGACPQTPPSRHTLLLSSWYPPLSHNSKSCMKPWSPFYDLAAEMNNSDCYHLVVTFVSGFSVVSLMTQVRTRLSWQEAREASVLARDG